jgi:hypothetical protein
MHGNFFVGLQEVDNMTRENIQDELKAVKEDNAADEGNFSFNALICVLHLSLLERSTEFLVCLCLKLYVNFWYRSLLYFVRNFVRDDLECACG